MERNIDPDLDRIRKERNKQLEELGLETPTLNPVKFLASVRILNVYVDKVISLRNYPRDMGWVYKTLMLSLVIGGLIGDYLREREPKISLARAPGSWMLQLTGVIFSKRSNELVFQPLVADYRREYFEAIHRRDGRMAGRIRFHYSTAFVCALVRKLWAPLVLLVVGLFKRSAS